jgi:hypothetical protein
MDRDHEPMDFGERCPMRGESLEGLQLEISPSSTSRDLIGSGWKIEEKITKKFITRNPQKIT